MLFMIKNMFCISHVVVYPPAYCVGKIVISAFPENETAKLQNE